MRAWFFQSLATRNGARDWSAFDHTLAVARSHGVKVIVTLGNQWGDCETGGYRTDQWYAVRLSHPPGSPGSSLSYAAWVATGRRPLPQRPHDPGLAVDERGRGQAVARKHKL